MKAPITPASGRNQKFIEPVDRAVGARVRLRRKQLGISQTELADRVGVTFQQIQKYEKGTNRISSSRIQLIANALDLPVSAFFDGSFTAADFETGELLADLSALSKDSIELNQAFMKIKKRQTRDAIIQFVALLAERVVSK